MLGDLSSGAQDDLKRASEIAFEMVAHFGMSERVGPVYHEHRVEQPFLGRSVAVEGATSDATVHLIEEEVRRILAGALDGARRCVEENRAVLDRFAAALLEHETLDKPEIVRLLGTSGAASQQP